MTDHHAPNHEIDDANKPRRERHTPVGIIRRPVQLPPMRNVQVATSDEPGGWDEIDEDDLRQADATEPQWDEDEDEDLQLRDELGRLEDQIS